MRSIPNRWLQMFTSAVSDKLARIHEREQHRYLEAKPFRQGGPALTRSTFLVF
jgi:hypothetical protein